MLLLPGTGLGLALVNPSQGESDLPEFSFAPASAWTARMLVSFWIAGGHGAHGPPRPDNYGGLHGVFAWAVGSLLPAFVMVRSTSLVLGQALLRSAQQSLTARPGPVAMERRVPSWMKSRPRATRRPISRRGAPVGEILTVLNDDLRVPGDTTRNKRIEQMPRIRALNHAGAADLVRSRERTMEANQARAMRRRPRPRAGSRWQLHGRGDAFGPAATTHAAPGRTSS